MSETNDTTNAHDDIETRSTRIEETPKSTIRALGARRRTARLRAARLRYDTFVSTGCPIADVVESGLTLDPRIGCGPAYVERWRLVWIRLTARGSVA